jgi:hypothetical protein
MYYFYFSCTFEEVQWQMRALVYVNDFLYLFEVEPEDKKLKSLYGAKFITQQRADFHEIRCHHPVRGHLDYECAILAGLRQHLLTNRVMG